MELSNIFALDEGNDLPTPKGPGHGMVGPGGAGSGGPMGLGGGGGPGGLDSSGGGGNVGGTGGGGPMGLLGGSGSNPLDPSGGANNNPNSNSGGGPMGLGSNGPSPNDLSNPNLNSTIAGTVNTSGTNAPAQLHVSNSSKIKFGLNNLNLLSTTTGGSGSSGDLKLGLGVKEENPNSSSFPNLDGGDDGPGGMSGLTGGGPGEPGKKRRKIQWNNARFLQCIVAAGLNAKDPVWRREWEKMTTITNQLPSQTSVLHAPMSILQSFIEKNLFDAYQKPWSGEILFENVRHSSGGGPDMKDDGDDADFENMFNQPGGILDPNHPINTAAASGKDGNNVNPDGSMNQNNPNLINGGGVNNTSGSLDNPNNIANNMMNNPNSHMEGHPHAMNPAIGGNGLPPSATDQFGNPFSSIKGAPGAFGAPAGSGTQGVNPPGGIGGQIQMMGRPEPAGNTVATIANQPVIFLQDAGHTGFTGCSGGFGLDRNGSTKMNTDPPPFPGSVEEKSLIEKRNKWLRKLRERRDKRQRDYESEEDGQVDEHGEPIAGGREKKKRRKRIQLTSMLGFSDQEEHDDKNNDGNSTDEETLMSDGPNALWKTRICYAFLENRCDKGKYCGFAHHEKDIKQPGEARAEWQRKLRERGVIIPANMINNPPAPPQITIPGLMGPGGHQLPPGHPMHSGTNPNMIALGAPPGFPPHMAPPPGHHPGGPPPPGHHPGFPPGHPAHGQPPPGHHPGGPPPPGHHPGFPPGHPAHGQPPGVPPGQQMPPGFGQAMGPPGQQHPGQPFPPGHPGHPGHPGQFPPGHPQHLVQESSPGIEGDVDEDGNNIDGHGKEKKKKKKKDKDNNHGDNDGDEGGGGKKRKKDKKGDQEDNHMGSGNYGDGAMNLDGGGEDEGKKKKKKGKKKIEEDDL